eukprot:COSAG02_NODE_56413_length_285_cov_1.645161_1_plen_23_part_10
MYAVTSGMRAPVCSLCLPYAECQ